MHEQAACPKRVVFVLKETEPERWISNGGDFYAYLKPPGVDEVVEKVYESHTVARPVVVQVNTCGSGKESHRKASCNWGWIVNRLNRANNVVAFVQS